MPPFSQWPEWLVQTTVFIGLAAMHIAIISAGAKWLAGPDDLYMGRGDGTSLGGSSFDDGGE